MLFKINLKARKGIYKQKNSDIYQSKQVVNRKNKLCAVCGTEMKPGESTVNHTRTEKSPNNYYIVKYTCIGKCTNKFNNSLFIGMIKSNKFGKRIQEVKINI